jgi:hypothetical protein
MRAQAWITTSWDDGHPLDFRIAQLLAECGLRGTFYVPRTSEHGTMSEAKIRELAAGFEIGAHTVHHVDLTGVDDRVAWGEIVDSKAWLEDLLGRRCTMFCAPLGRYRRSHLDLIRQARYEAIRTVEFFSVDRPRSSRGLLVMPTTMQAHPHGAGVCICNAMRRGAVGNLWRYIRHGIGCAWEEMAESIMGDVMTRGGVFHLWGHAWELEERASWARLEKVLRMLGRATRNASAVTNGELCAQVTRRPLSGTLPVSPATGATRRARPVG